VNGWAPLDDGLVDSSVWEEPDHVFRTFIGMMSLKGPDHIVRMDSYKLHRRMHMELPLLLDALKVLTSPDKKRLGQPYEGRRLEAVDGGWRFINGEKYREQVRLLMKRARNARAQANWRAKKAGKPLPYPTRPRSSPAPVEHEGDYEADAASAAATVVEGE
jgi:hypothetical protein